MDAGSLVFGALAVAAGILLLAFREPLGERARRRGAPLGARLSALAGVLLVFYGAVTLVAQLYG
jgi:hypothetical protein